MANILINPYLVNKHILFLSLHRASSISANSIDSLRQINGSINFELFYREIASDYRAGTSRSRTAMHDHGRRRILGRRLRDTTVRRFLIYRSKSTHRCRSCFSLSIFRRGFPTWRFFSIAVTVWGLCRCPVSFPGKRNTIQDKY